MTAQDSLFPPALPDKTPEPHYIEASLDAVARAPRVAIDCETTGPQPMTAAVQQNWPFNKTIIQNFQH